jgi:RNA polymerase sigma-70 factor (ECF subfamily)
VENKELSDKIQSAIEKLPENLRITFVLVAAEGKSYADTAQILELNIDAVRMRMARARKQLRSILEPYLRGKVDM